MNRDIPCFIAAHFQLAFCKMDEFYKKKKLLFFGHVFINYCLYKTKKEKA